MKVTELGEFGLIDLLAGMISGARTDQPAFQNLIIGIGDDAAAWHSDSLTQLATVDSLIEGIHFSLDTISWRELGWKSLAVNLSDIAAMGGVPDYALISLALPEDTEVEDVKSLYEGMIELGQQSQVAIAGGDTCRSPVVSITVSVFGHSQNNRLLRRSSAVPGDVIAVTGYLGSAAAGLEMLTDKLHFNKEVTDYLREAFLLPRPRLAEGQLLVKQGVIAAIDISDGLLADLQHICQSSRVSARVDVDRLPIHAMVRDNFGERAREMALAGGEDYELLFTGNIEAINKIQAEASCPVTVIGEITADEPGKISLFDAKGKPFSINETGWKHF